MTKYHKRGVLVEGFSVRKHPNYFTYHNMKQRCFNKNLPGYKNYGGRGIKICDRWLESFENFCEDMGIKPNPNLSIERIDNDQGYYKENCKWGTKFEQSDNRRIFENNTSGIRGVDLVKSGRYKVRNQSCNVRKMANGTFSTIELAENARQDLISGVISDKERTCRYDNPTRIKGISKRDDGYLVRRTHEGKRHYVGFFQTLDEAIEGNRIWDVEKKSNKKYNV